MRVRKGRAECSQAFIVRLEFVYVNYWRYSLVIFAGGRRHRRLQGDWSSDVCSSDLLEQRLGHRAGPGRVGFGREHLGIVAKHLEIEHLVGGEAPETGCREAGGKEQDGAAG